MPFRKWIVEPVHLYVSPKNDNKGEKGEVIRDLVPGYELETVVNMSIVKCLHQLASVVKVADRIFEDVGSECRIVYERTVRLRIKIGTCRDAANKLNARAVEVPISSDLCTVSKLLRQKKPYKTVYSQRTQLFLPSNRPPCIDELYKEASASPVSVICTVDKYRTDGRTSSELFMVTPVLGGEDTRKKRRRKMLDIETRKPANFSLARSQQDDSKSGGDELIGNDDEPKPSTSYDDGDGSRITTLDRLPSPEEQTMAMSLEYPSTVVSVDVSGSSFFRMTSCRRSLIHADFVIKRRKNKGKQKRRHTVCEGNNRELETALQNITMVNSSCQTDDLTPEAPPTTFFRRSFYRRRAKSMEGVRRETVALDGLNLDLSSKRSESSNQSSQADGLNNATISKKNGANQTSSKKQGKFSLMTRAAANPILNSLSSALTSAAVRLRHPTRSKQDVDGRSSSGNWSASSSTRASVDSDQHHAAVLAAVDRSSNLSRSSAGKDSLLSEATQHESVRSQENGTGSGQVPTLESLSDKARALRNAQPWEYDRGRESCNSTPERSSDCASTPLVISPYIGRRNRFNFYGAGSSIDDGESSVYSVDTDGYYTSMHTDSGLWNGLGSPKNGDFRARHRRESQSSISTIGNISVNSILSRTVTETSETGSFKIHRFAPEPPPRSSSNDQKTVVNVDITEKPINDDPFDFGSVNRGFDKDSSPPRNTGSASESDYETGDRIRCKTTINSSRYPSLCAVSPETSDDELAELREKSKSPTVSIVVAEVHRCDDSTVPKRPESGRGRQTPRDTVSASPSSTGINMYSSNSNQSPAKSLFNSSLIRSGQISTSTPKHAPPTTVSSFAAECPGNAKDLATTEKQTNEHPCRLPVSAKSFCGGVKLREMTAVPIPSVPSVNATLDIGAPKLVPQSSRTEQSSQDTKTDIVKTVSAAAAKSKSFLKNPLNSLPFRQSENHSPKPNKSSPPSYISFQSPDSPVSSSTALSTDNLLSPSSASSTIDQESRLSSYLSHSLDRSKSHCSDGGGDSPGWTSHPATLPRYQSSSSMQGTEPKLITDSQLLERIPSSRNVATEKLDAKPPLQGGDRNVGSADVTQQLDQHQRPTQSAFFRPTRGGRFCRTYFPSHLIQPRDQPPAESRTNPTQSPTPTNQGSRLSGQSSINEIGLPIVDPYPQPPKITRTLFPTSNYPPSPVSRTGNVCVNVRDSPVQFTSSPALPGKWGSFRGGSFPSSGETNTALRVPAATYKFQPLPAKTSLTQMGFSSGSPRQALVSVSTPTTSRIFDQITRNKTLDMPNSLKDFSPRSPQPEFTPPNPPDLIPSSSTPPSTLDITSRTCPRQTHQRPDAKQPAPTTYTGDHQRRLKPLSSNELFAIIHDSKKKHNIRSESEKSLSPISSRSSSPSVVSSVPSPSKSQRIETGVLSRYCDSPSPSLSGGSVYDRFGKSKPTSMHDFKMLLLQARTGSQEAIPRPSAAELLKVSPTRRSLVGSPAPANTRQTNSPSWTRGRLSSPQNQPPVHVPAKRSMRTRSPYLTRYDSAYPPIWEDCSEDMEDTADENRNTVVNSITLAPVEEVLGNGNRYRCTPVNRNILDNQPPSRTSTWV